MKIIFLALFLAGALSLSVQGQNSKLTCIFLKVLNASKNIYYFVEKVICYWGTWSHYRPGNGQFRYNHIDGNLCTHVLYAFLGISGQGGVRFFDSWLDINLNNLQNSISIKRQYPDLKLIVSIGGWSESSSVFSNVARSAQLRETFATNVLGFLNTYGFDGVDIDWEYPGTRGGDRSIDKANFILFLEALYKK